METFGYIYKTTNLVNNKVYIGKHLGEFERQYLGSGKVIKHAIRKYGKDNFAVILIGQAINKETIKILECYYIAYYRNLLGWDMVYNLTDGGEGGDTYTNHPNKKLVRKNHKLASLKHRKVKGTNCKCICCRTKRKELTGKNHPMFGRYHTKESKNQNRLKHLGKTLEETHKKNCPCSFCKVKRGEMKGVSHTKKHIDKIREGVKRNWILRHNKLYQTKEVLPCCP